MASTNGNGTGAEVLTGIGAAHVRAALSETSARLAELDAERAESLTAYFVRAYAESGKATPAQVSARVRVALTQSGFNVYDVDGKTVLNQYADDALLPRIESVRSARSN